MSEEYTEGESDETADALRAAMIRRRREQGCIAVYCGGCDNGPCYVSGVQPAAATPEGP